MQDGQGAFISQKKYAQDLLKMLNMVNCKPAPTPMFANDKLHAEDGSGDADSRRYRSLIRCLIYLTHTRPDITFTVRVLSRYMSKPSKAHAEVGKAVPGYLAGKVDYGLNYTHGAKCKLEGYSDNDWGGSLEDRKNTLGVVFNIGLATIAWMSKK